MKHVSLLFFFTFVVDDLDCSEARRLGNARNKHSCFYVIRI